MIRFVAAILIITICLAASKLEAHNHVYQELLRETEIQPDSILEVTDGRYNDMQAGNFTFINARIVNELRLAIDLKGYNPSAPFTTSVRMLLQYDEWVDNHFESRSREVFLTVNYTSTGAFKDKAVYRFYNAHKLKATITQVSGPTTGIVLLGQIDVTRFEQFDPEAILTGDMVYADLLAERNELQIQWDTIVGAEEYELEWTSINDYGTGNEPLTPENITIDKSLFRTNSSRVTIVGNKYAIPLLYDRGYILYRVRGIGRKETDTGIVPIDGRWSYEPQQGHTVANVPHSFRTVGHQNDLNWQATVSYAEEGKSKAAISYFDGSLRNRQAVSRINSEDKIIVGETMYDHQGRPAIQVLPVPARNPRIGYQRSFNRDADGQPYAKDDFDIDENCEVSPPAMSTTSGASRYYSIENPDKEGAQAFLPDAKGYPFTQTEYTPDNTGRIRRQSGVGPDHKLGSNHETKYFYGKPAQEELDKMFGNDVGYAKHYKKNMVIDANGQISVSYLDPQGRVIATSLAGETPENLINIAAPEETITTQVDLLSKVRPSDKTGTEDHLSIDGRSRVLFRELLVTQQGTRDFEYSVSTGSYREDCFIGPPAPACYGCVLDLSISITDECGNQVIPPIGVDGTTSRAVGEINTQFTGTSSQFSVPFTSSLLDPGNYSIHRKLSINEEALDAYTDDFIAYQEDCILPFEYFLGEEAKNVEMFACVSDCQSCRDAVGDIGKYTGPDCNPCLNEEEYEALLAQCDFLCDDELIQCKNAFNMMLADVSPFGQYGEIMNSVAVDEDGNITVPDGPQEVDPTKFDLSVFNENNQLPKNNFGTGTGYWKFPNGGLYKSEDGSDAVVDILVLIDEATGQVSYSPQLEEGFDATPGRTPEHGEIIQVPPHKLHRVQDFLANWESSWAEQLVHLHPEYGYYTFCTILEPSHQWDVDWLSAETLEQAVEKGYLPAGVLKPNPLTPNTSFTDPYFYAVSNYLVTNVSSSWTDYNQAEFAAMSRSLNNYADGFDIWEVVHRTVNCPYDDSNSNICQACPSNDGINTDEEWETFKSLYFSLKQQFVERKTTIYAISTDSYNGCIGAEGYNPFEFTFYRTNVFSFATTLALLRDSQQPCNWINWRRGLYEKKQKRFPLSTDMMDNTGLDLYACYTGFDENTSGDPFTPDQQVTCSNSLRDIIEESKLQVDIGFYETCGQCPIIFYLQNFLDAVVERKELIKTNVQLSCYPESNYPQFTGDLEQQIIQAIPGQGIWYWDGSFNSGIVTANISKHDGAGTCTVQLKIPQGVSLSSIESVCCVNHITNPVEFPLTGNGNFIMKATVAGSAEKISIEGFVSCLDLATCTFPPRCQATQEAPELQVMLNALLFDFALTSGVSDDLFSSTPINLYEYPYDSIVLGTMAPLEQNLTGTNWTWRSQVSGNVLTGFIEDGQGGSCLVELRPEVNIPFDITQIIGFTNIRPDRKHPSDPAKNFLITAIVETNQGKLRVKMRGYSGCFDIGTCTPVTVGGN